MISEFDDDKCGAADCAGDDCEDCGFQYGKIMTAVWDITAFGADNNSHPLHGDNVFAKAPEEDAPGNWVGGGVNKLGIMLGPNREINGGINMIESVDGGVRWNDVRIFVKDMDKFNEFIEELEEITGKTMSANAKANVKQA
jgi:hypothetical protein